MEMRKDVDCAVAKEAVGMKFSFAFDQHKEQGRDQVLARLTSFARWGMRLCMAGCALCLLMAFWQVGAALNRFPAPIPEVLSWDCVGLGANFDSERPWPVYCYLVEDADALLDEDLSAPVSQTKKYLIQNPDGSSPVASEIANTVTWALGSAVLALGVTFFRDVERADSPFGTHAPRRLKVAGAMAIAMGVVPNVAGLLVSSAALTWYTTPVGEWRWGVWECDPASLWLIAAGLFLIAVGVVFEYGSILQKQDDELF